MSEAITESAAAPPPTDTTLTPPAAVPEWRAALPVELRDAPSLATFKTVEDLAKSQVEAQSMIGRKGLIIPKADDPSPVHAAYRQALGIPEKPDGYEIKVEGAPETVWNKDTAATFSGWAHELGLTPAQAQGIAERYAKLGGDGMAADTAARERTRAETTKALQTEWGTAYDAKVERAQRAVREFGGDDLIKALQESGMGSNPAMVRAMAAIGEKIGEDRPAGMGTGRPAADNPDAELKSLMATGTPYWQPLHPEHQQAVARVKELYRVKAG